MFTPFRKKLTQLNDFVKGIFRVKRYLTRVNYIKLKKGFFKNPLFYFSVLPFILFGLLFSGTNSLAQLSYVSNEVSFLRDNSGNGDPFFNQNKALGVETPDLKIIQDSFVYGISTPRILTTQTLGSIFGESPSADSHAHGDNEPFDYTIVAGDTIQSIALHFNISVNTVLWANSLSKNSTLKVGQILTILPVSGLIHVVKSGDTISELTKKYKTKSEEIIAFNNLANEGDIFIGDILIIPDGVMPLVPIVSTNAQLANNFFIYAAEGRVSQGLHYYNAKDIANKCGTPVYAAASGVVQRAQYGWNSGGGNLVTILHTSGVGTYYGHLMTIFVKSGEAVEVGQRIGLMGTTGISTGCHLHFGVTGAANPLPGVGSILKFK